MTRDPLRALCGRATPQSQPADPRQVPNSAGGYVFTVDPLTRLRRFLTLGVDGGTYHVEERDLTRGNAAALLDLLVADAPAAIDCIVQTSTSGRAPRQRPALFALAVAASVADVEHRRAALDCLPDVARTFTHLAEFLNYAQQFRGWGRQLRRAVGDWYLRHDVDDLAYQVIKYRRRAGWTHRDVLRKSHPRALVADADRRQLMDWVCGRWSATSSTEHRFAPDSLRLLEGYERVQREDDPRRVADLVTEYDLPWEALPDAALGSALVWEALLDRGLPQTALLRQLPRLTRLGLLSPLGDWTPRVTARLTNPEALRRARVHPFQLLVAQTTYAGGHSLEGRSTWAPSRPVVDALDAGFYAAYGAVRPTNRRFLLALDVSGSMHMATIARTRLTPREASAALALVTLNVEPRCEVVGFTGAGAAHSLHSRYRTTPAVAPLSLSPRQRLDDVVRYTRGLTFGATDCALPMLYALENRLEVDVFVIYTDSESWAGSVHVHEALRRYRESTGIPARLAVVGMTATDFTVADPRDALSLNVEGLDASVPQLISDLANSAP